MHTNMVYLKLKRLNKLRVGKFVGLMQPIKHKAPLLLIAGKLKVMVRPEAQTSGTCCNLVQPHQHSHDIGKLLLYS